ncbi:MAG: hydrogenase nickel incorporation protein HypB [Candidatus Heimdallarchaeota archaeon]
MPKEEFSKIIELNEDLIKNNEELAQQNSRKFKRNKVRCFEIVGAIGAGKTALIEVIVKKISNEKQILVINGDVTTRVDANRIEKHGVKTIQINTGKECALNSYHISQVVKNHDISRYNVIFIENVGNLICPSDFILGAEKRVCVVSITEGEWVIEKHPMLFKMSDLAVINKIDLLDVVEVNIDKMINDAMGINPHIKLIKSSAITGEGIPELIETLFKK